MGAISSIALAFGGVDNKKSMIRDAILLVFVLSWLNSCSPRTGTPDVYVNRVIPTSDVYSSDSIELLADLYEKMRKHEASFAHSEYFDSTHLAIDTIIYDSSLNKIAVFVIAKNPTYRNPHSESKLPYYYNANCYIGKRKSINSSSFHLKCLCRFSEINFEDEKKVAQALRDDFFLELATVLDAAKQPIFGYNIDDRRFWDSASGWKRIFPELNE